MSAQHPIVEDAELGTLVRAISETDAGTTITSDWYTGVFSTDAGELDLMVEGATPRDISPLLPRLREIVHRIDPLRRIASDAVVAKFSASEPEPHELEEGASDLVLETIEASADGTIILHLIDLCGEHFPEGYWPAVHLGADDRIEQVTIES